VNPEKTAMYTLIKTRTVASAFLSIRLTTASSLDRNALNISVSFFKPSPSNTFQDVQNNSQETSIFAFSKQAQNGIARALNSNKPMQF
jgi:hypothetical protein